MSKWHRAALATAVTAITGAGIASLAGAGAGLTANATPAATPAAGGSAARSVAANIRVVEGFLRDVIDEHHGNHAAAHLTADMSWHGGTVGTVSGRANVAGLFAGVVAALPDAHATIYDAFGQGNEVVVRLVVAGTQRGPVLGIPASGRAIHWDGVDIFRVTGGKISEIWAGDDWSAILYYTGTYKAPWIR